MEPFNNNVPAQTMEENKLAGPQLRLPTKEEVDLAILVGSKVIIPTIKLFKGRFRKKSVETRLSYGAVFTFYDPISIEDYNSMFAQKIKEFYDK